MPGPSEGHQAGAKRRVRQQVRRRVGMRYVEVGALIAGRHLADPPKPAIAGVNVGGQDIFDAGSAQIRVPHDRSDHCALRRGRRATGGLGRHEFRLAHRPIGLRPVGAPGRQALHKDGGLHVVTRSGVGPQLLQRVPAGGAIPEMVVRVADRQVRFEGYFAHALDIAAGPAGCRTDRSHRHGATHRPTAPPPHRPTGPPPGLGENAGCTLQISDRNWRDVRAERAQSHQTRPGWGRPRPPPPGPAAPARPRTPTTQPPRRQDQLGGAVPRLFPEEMPWDTTRTTRWPVPPPSPRVEHAPPAPAGRAFSA